jgi:hypothetical protein
LSARELEISIVSPKFLRVGPDFPQILSNMLAMCSIKPFFWPKFSENRSPICEIWLQKTICDGTAGKNKNLPAEFVTRILFICMWYPLVHLKLLIVHMKGYYFGGSVFVLSALFLQGPIRIEALGLPMSSFKATAVGYLIGLFTVMAAGLYSFWRNHPFNVGELPEWLLSEQSPLKRRGQNVRGKNTPAKGQESETLASDGDLENLTFQPSLEELPIPANPGRTRKARNSVLKSLNARVPKLKKPRIFDLPEEFPCPYVCEAEQTANDAGEK